MKFLSNHKNKYQIKQNYQSLLIPMHSIKHGSINCYENLFFHFEKVLSTTAI